MKRTMSLEQKSLNFQLEEELLYVQLCPIPRCFVSNGATFSSLTRECFTDTIISQMESVWMGGGIFVLVQY